MPAAQRRVVRTAAAAWTAEAVPAAITTRACHTVPAAIPRGSPFPAPATPRSAASMPRSHTTVRASRSTKRAEAAGSCYTGMGGIPVGGHSSGLSAPTPQTAWAAPPSTSAHITAAAQRARPAPAARGSGMSGCLAPVGSPTRPLRWRRFIPARSATTRQAVMPHPTAATAAASRRVASTPAAASSAGAAPVVITTPALPFPGATTPRSAARIPWPRTSVGASRSTRRAGAAGSCSIGALTTIYRDFLHLLAPGQSVASPRRTAQRKTSAFPSTSNTQTGTPAQRAQPTAREIGLSFLLDGSLQGAATTCPPTRPSRWWRSTAEGATPRAAEKIAHAWGGRGRLCGRFSKTKC